MSEQIDTQFEKTPSESELAKIDMVVFVDRLKHYNHEHSSSAKLGKGIASAMSKQWLTEDEILEKELQEVQKEDTPEAIVFKNGDDLKKIGVWIETVQYINDFFERNNKPKVENREEYQTYIEDMEKFLSYVTALRNKGATDYQKESL